MEINDDYRAYLQLKESSIKKELDAFENYRQAARSFRDNYDPKNTSVRDKVKEEFKTRSENYQKIMEGARDDSSKANELAKDALKKARGTERVSEKGRRVGEFPDRFRLDFLVRTVRERVPGANRSFAPACR